MTPCGHLYHYYCLKTLKTSKCSKCQSELGVYSHLIYLEFHGDSQQTIKQQEAKITELTKEVTMLQGVLSEIPDNRFEAGKKKGAKKSCTKDACKETKDQLDMEVMAREFTLKENHRLTEENRKSKENAQELKKVIEDLLEATSTSQEPTEPKVIEVLFPEDILDEKPLLNKM